MSINVCFASSAADCVCSVLRFVYYMNCASETNNVHRNCLAELRKTKKKDCQFRGNYSSLHNMFELSTCIKEKEFFLFWNEASIWLIMSFKMESFVIIAIVIVFFFSAACGSYFYELLNLAREQHAMSPVTPTEKLTKNILWKDVIRINIMIMMRNQTRTFIFKKSTVPHGLSDHLLMIPCAMVIYISFVSTSL